MKKKKTNIIKGDDVELTTSVVISDPCYEIPTWCQTVLRSKLKPGTYHTFVLQTDESDWGIRNARLFAIHHEHINDDLNWELGETIGVDSGQAGIFSLSTYQNDSIANEITYPENGEWEGSILPKFKAGDDWYEKMCGISINNPNGFGCYKNGVVSRSGIGDGGYNVFYNKSKVNGKNKITAICIDFGLSETDIENNFTKSYANELQ